MQRRAIRDAKTPEKMKQVQPVVDDSLTLQGKKDKIKSNLQRLAELGKVDPQNRYQDLINDIAKVDGKDSKCLLNAWCLHNKGISLFHVTENHVCYRTSGIRGDTVSVGKLSWWGSSRQTRPSTPRQNSSMCRLTLTISISRHAWTTWPAKESKSLC